MATEAMPARPIRAIGLRAGTVDPPINFWPMLHACAGEEDSHSMTRAFTQLVRLLLHSGESHMGYTPQVTSCTER
jgi:hypothetical protein